MEGGGEEYGRGKGGGGRGYTTFSLRLTRVCRKEEIVVSEGGWAMVNTVLTKSMYPSYLLCINKFGLPPSAS